MEEFRSINGYESYYEISNLGNVKTLYGRYKKCIFKKPFVRKDGYVVINLVKDNKQTTFYLHRLVAGHFIPQDGNILKSEVNHKDGNKQNNSVDNLEWCTVSENKKHAYNTGLTKIGSKRTSSKLTEEIVYQIPQLIKDGISIINIAKKFGVSKTAIYHVLTGRNYGFLNIDFGYTFKSNNKTTPR